MLEKPNLEARESYLTEILYLQAQKNVEILNHEIQSQASKGKMSEVFKLEEMLEAASKQAFNLSLQLS